MSRDAPLRFLMLEQSGYWSDRIEAQLLVELGHGFELRRTPGLWAAQELIRDLEVHGVIYAGDPDRTSPLYLRTDLSRLRSCFPSGPILAIATGMRPDAEASPRVPEALGPDIPMTSSFGELRISGTQRPCHLAPDSASIPEICRFMILEARAARPELADERRSPPPRQRDLAESFLALPDPAFLIDRRLQIIAANLAAARLQGKRIEDLVGTEFDLPLDTGRVSEHRIGARTFELSCTKQRIAGKPCYVAVFRDVSARTEFEEDLATRLARFEQLARIDPLCSIYNRRGLEQALSQELARCSRTGAQLAVLMLDIDGLKAINSRFGHAIGDRILAGTAKTLVETLRPTDVIARVGGDEFVVLLSGARLAEAHGVALRIQAALGERALEPGVPRHSVGIAVSLVPEDSATVRELLLLTRNALKLSKQAGSASVVVYEPPPRNREGQERGGDRVVSELWPIRLHDLEEEDCIAWSSRLLENQRDLEEALREVPPTSDKKDWHLLLAPALFFDLDPKSLLASLSEEQCRRTVLAFLLQHCIGDSAKLEQVLEPYRRHGIRIALHNVDATERSYEVLIQLRPAYAILSEKLFESLEPHNSPLARVARRIEALDGLSIAPVPTVARSSSSLARGEHIRFADLGIRGKLVANRGKDRSDSGSSRP